MVQRQVPHREGFKFCIACADATLVFVIQLGEAGCHFAAAGTGSGDHHQAAGGFNIFVLSISLVADDVGDIGRVALDGVMAVDLDAQRFQPLLKGNSDRLTLEAGHHNAADIQPKAAEDVDQAQNVDIIGDAQVAADFIFFNIGSVDDHHHLHLFFELEEHPQLAVRLKTRKNTGGVVIIVQLPAKLQIQLAAKLRDALADVFRLCVKIFFVVKSNFLHNFHASLSKIYVYMKNQSSYLLYSIL
ncbi:uncharacterized protein BN513_01225 [Clostridium sp. CAG:169]|nr:uncharacterized protein BN513_01225 [Clostridium sp. CAG:169]